MPIRAGQLRHRVFIETPSKINTHGLTTTTWAAEIPAWVRITPLSGRELEEARKVVPEATHLVQARYQEEITEEKRIEHNNRYLYIEHVANVDERNVELLLTCVERK